MEEGGVGGCGAIERDAEVKHYDDVGVGVSAW
jgi:hypothetical protein